VSLSLYQVMVVFPWPMPARDGDCAQEARRFRSRRSGG